MFFNCCKKMFRSKRLGAYVISLVFLLSCRDNKEGRSADTTGEAPSELLSNKNRQGDRDHMQALVQSILDKDPRATLLVKKVGSAANSELQKLAQHKDQEVREIALLCLNETGGPDAAMTFVRSLRDEDSQVRAVALRGLQRLARLIIECHGLQCAALRTQRERRDGGLTPLGHFDAFG